MMTWLVRPANAAFIAHALGGYLQDVWI